MGDSSLVLPWQNVLSPHHAFLLCLKKEGELLEGWTHHIAATRRLGPEKLYDNIEIFIGTSSLSLGEVARTETDRR